MAKQQNDISRAPGLLETAARVRMLVLDVDGVLTDGRLWFDPDGRELKSFHVRDGYGIRRLLESGVQVAVISGRRSRATEARMAELGVRHVLLGQREKLPAFERLLEVAGLTPAEVACVGDDLPDLPLLERAGLAIAVADADPALVACSHWQTGARGGCGAVREVCDLLHTAGAGRGAKGAAGGKS